MLSREELNEIITWLPHGCSWKIVNKSRFVDKVIPKFFNHKNFKSFLRQVNGWGFMRVNKGLDEGSYYHKSFLRGEPMLARSINRPSNFKATCSRFDDPPKFRPLYKQKSNRHPNDFAHSESLDPSPSLRRSHSNHAISETSAVTEDSLLGTISALTDERVLQTNISRVVTNSVVPQSMNSSAILHILIDHRQREIKTMLYLEELKRMSISSLLSNSRNTI